MPTGRACATSSAASTRKRWGSAQTATSPPGGAAPRSCSRRTSRLLTTTGRRTSSTSRTRREAADERSCGLRAQQSVTTGTRACLCVLKPGSAHVLKNSPLVRLKTPRASRRHHRVGPCPSCARATPSWSGAS